MTVAFASLNLITNADMSSSFQSEDINLSGKVGFSIHSVFTGTPDGSFYIAVSIDKDNWIILPDSTQTVNAAGDVFYNVNDSKYLWARLHWVDNGGDPGNCNSKFSLKGVE